MTIPPMIILSYLEEIHSLLTLPALAIDMSNYLNTPLVGSI